MNKFYNIGEFSKLINVKVKTLQKWDRDGTLNSFRTPTDRRYYTHKQYLEYIGESIKCNNGNERMNIMYPKIPTLKQTEDLLTQIDKLEQLLQEYREKIKNIDGNGYIRNVNGYIQIFRKNGDMDG